MKLWKSLFIGIAVLMTASCTASTPQRELSPLVVASCPELPPSTDPTFGGIILDLLDTIAQYEKCRKAALAELK